MTQTFGVFEAAGKGLPAATRRDDLKDRGRAVWRGDVGFQPAKILNTRDNSGCYIPWNLVAAASLGLRTGHAAASTLVDDTDGPGTEPATADPDQVSPRLARQTPRLPGLRRAFGSSTCAGRIGPPTPPPG